MPPVTDFNIISTAATTFNIVEQSTAILFYSIRFTYQICINAPLIPKTRKQTHFIATLPTGGLTTQHNFIFGLKCPIWELCV